MMMFRIRCSRQAAPVVAQSAAQDLQESLKEHGGQAVRLIPRGR